MRPVFCALTSRWTHSNGVRSLPVLSACTTCVCVGASGRGEGGGSERGAGEEERWGELNLSELQSRAEQLQAFLSSASSSSNGGGAARQIRRLRLVSRFRLLAGLEDVYPRRGALSEAGGKGSPASSRRQKATMTRTQKRSSAVCSRRELGLSASAAAREGTREKAFAFFFLSRLVKNLP